MAGVRVFVTYVKLYTVLVDPGKGFLWLIRDGVGTTCLVQNQW
jgi:hypothetical protein